MARGQIPKFTWGSGFVNTLNIGYQLDSVITYRKPREGSERQRARSGVGDAWDAGTDYILEATVRWIPAANGTNPTQTGWDGSTGFDAFLRYAWDPSVQVRFFPDKDSGTFLLVYVDQPDNDKPVLESDGTRQVRLILRSLTTAFTGY